MLMATIFEQRHPAATAVQRTGTLQWDGMAVLKEMTFNAADNTYSGWATAGGNTLGAGVSEMLLPGQRKQAEGALASHLLEFIWTSHGCKFAFPVAYYLTASITHVQLLDMLAGGITLLAAAGFTTLSGVQDGAPENRALKALVCGSSKVLLEHFSLTKYEYEWSLDAKFIAINPANPARSFFMTQDPRHVGKLGRNSAMVSYMPRANGKPPLRLMEWRGKLIRWQDLLDVYDWDLNNIPKMTKVSGSPASIR
jgi:hypothetical protein